MPRPASTKRKQPRNKPSATANVVRAEDDGFQFDSMDILMGVVFAIAVPAITYVVLGMAGMPVSGAATKDALSAMEEKERRTQVASTVALVPREFDAKFKWVRGLLKDRVPEYIRRAEEEDDATVKDRWVRAAITTCGHCEGILDSLASGIDGNKHFADDSSYAQSLRSQVSLLAELRREIRKHDAFKGLRGS